MDSNLHHLYGENDANHQGYRDLFINMCSNRYDLEARESMFEVEFYGNGMDRSNECGKVGLYIGISQGVTTDQDVPYAYAWYDATKILYRLYENGGKIMLEKTRATSAAGGTLPTTATRLMIKPVKYRRIT